MIEHPVPVPPCNPNTQPIEYVLRGWFAANLFLAVFTDIDDRQKR